MVSRGPGRGPGSQAAPAGGPHFGGAPGGPAGLRRACGPNGRPAPGRRRHAARPWGLPCLALRWCPLRRPPRPACLQSKRTKKVGIVGKYGTRYGASLRKQIKKIEVSQHSKYFCTFCGKVRGGGEAWGGWGGREAAAEGERGAKRGGGGREGGAGGGRRRRRQERRRGCSLLYIIIQERDGSCSRRRAAPGDGRRGRERHGAAPARAGELAGCGHAHGAPRRPLLLCCSTA